jgi:hypothetical protein
MAAHLPPEKHKRLVQFCGMLGSNFAGERAIAAKKATELLIEHQLTWETFLNGANGTAQPEFEWTASRPVAWREKARECQEYPDELTEWETEFIMSILGQQRTELSAKQQAALDRIHGRLFDSD